MKPVSRGPRRPPRASALSECRHSQRRRLNSMDCLMPTMYVATRRTYGGLRAWSRFPVAARPASLLGP
eukprot:2883950-Pleurochrysis_carterae.AAC.1